MRPARALIDLQALRHNYRLARELSAARALAVIKADAYGHGAVRCAQALQAEALQLQAQPRANADDAQRALQASVSAALGASARLVQSGDRATLTLKGTPADALAGWLAQARSNARAVPQEVRLVRSPAPESRTATTANTGTPPVRWDGSIVLALPPR